MCSECRPRELFRRRPDHVTKPDPAIFVACSNPSAGGYFAAGAVLGGLGAAVGAGVDALIHRDRNIYRRGGGRHVALSPAFGPGAGAVTLSISWGK